LSQLFRKEAIEHRVDRLHGDINLALPIGWQVIGYLFLAALISAILFLASASYAKIETVPGVIIPDKGVAIAVPTRPGVLTTLMVVEGQSVKEGQVIARIKSSETLNSGVLAPEQMASAINAQDVGLQSQSSALDVATSADRARLAAQSKGLADELVTIERQLRLQQSLVQSARDELDKTQEIAKRGFISRRDVLLREETLLARSQQLEQLQQSRYSKQSQLVEAQRSIAQSSAQNRVQRAGIETSRAELLRMRVDADSASGYVVTAPASGKATAITVRVGQAVNAQTAMLSIVPNGSKLRAELPVPATAIGFVSVGQSVRLSVDAFPYQQFGTVTGKIISVPSAAIPRQNADGTAIPIYPVIVEILDPTITAFGKRQSLISGMTLTARITTRKQTLWEWLFEPLYAVQRR
jgi:membrane fusion protein